MDAFRFNLDSRGLLTPESTEGEKQLGTRRGDWMLLPTGPDWMAWGRSPLQGGAAQPGRVVLSGDLAGFPLADLVAFLSQSRWNGVVRVHTAAGERSITLKEGEVRAASSDISTERLGEVMVRLGYVQRPLLEKTLRESPPSKVGRTLVEKGILQAHDLFKCVTHQVSEIFDAIMLSREGIFFLVDQPFDEKAQQNVQLSTQSLLMDAIRKLDELAHFRRRIPSTRLYVGRRAGAGSPPDNLEPEEKAVLPLIDGRHTVAELAQLARLSEFDAIKGVHRLLALKLAVVSETPVTETPARTPMPSTVPTVVPLEITPRPAVAPKTAAAAERQPVDQRTIVRVYNFIFREIRDEVSKQGMEREFIASANAALTNLTSSPVLSGVIFTEDGSLPEARVVEQFERTRGSLGADPLAALRQALADVMFFLLFQAGELLESRADEDLARRVKEMLSTLDKA